MRICAVQLQAKAGDLEGNLLRHLAAAEQAAAHGARLVLFPELSLSGYEPRLAGRLALRADAPVLTPLQRLCDSRNIVVGVGLPIPSTAGPRIGQVFFRPALPPLVHIKQHLHPDELSFFAAGEGPTRLQLDGLCLAPAICYESVQPEHAAAAARAGAVAYLASVAKSARGMRDAHLHYAEVARRHAMTVVVANALGPCDDFVAVGRSAAWNAQGEPLGQLDGEHPALLWVDAAANRGEILAADF